MFDKICLGFMKCMFVFAFLYLINAFVVITSSIIFKDVNLYWCIPISCIIAFILFLKLKKLDNEIKKDKQDNKTDNISFAEAESIIKTTGQVLAENNAIARKVSLLPCSVEKVRQAIKSVLEYVENNQDREQLLSLYLNVGSFVEDELAEKINNIYDSIKAHKIDINAPEYIKDKELIDNFLENISSKKYI